MTDHEVLGQRPPAEIVVLDESDFIYRYATILGLRDNIHLTSSNVVDDIGLRGIRGLIVGGPDTYEDRLEGHELHVEGMRRIGATRQQIEDMVKPVRPKKPMTEIEVERLADRIRSIREQQKLSLGQKFGRAVLNLSRGKLPFMSLQDRVLGMLPEAIEMIDSDTGKHQVLVNSSAEDTISRLTNREDGQ